MQDIIVLGGDKGTLPTNNKDMRELKITSKKPSQ